MKTTKTGMPTANLAINKSRIKLYNKDVSPTYYLKKGDEFQIELFNPTKGTLLAKIYLNSKIITQGGLVLRPGERVFLDRYIDVPNKFKFETYSVTNSEEVRKAIEDNGDFKVEFYKEKVVIPTYYPPTITIGDPYPYNIRYYTGDVYGSTAGTTTRGLGNTTTSGSNSTFNTTGLGVTNTTTSTFDCDVNFSSSIGQATMDSLDMSQDLFIPTRSATKGLQGSMGNKKRKTRKTSNKIETGTVEKGSRSSQTFETVSMDWDYFPICTVEYKLLPISQKVNTANELTIKKYCTECGAKTKSSFKFCPSCGNRA